MYQKRTGQMCDVHPSHYSWFWSGVGFFMEKGLGQMKLGARSRVLHSMIKFRSRTLLHVHGCNDIS